MSAQHTPTCNKTGQPSSYCTCGADMSPWQKIMQHAKHGTGLKLTASEVQQLSRDDAIRTVAENDDERS